MTLTRQEWDDLSEYRDSLEHYGVKGMKWGVRKDRKSSGTRRTSSSTKTTKAKERMGYLAERKKKQEAKKAEADAKKAEKKKQQEAKRRESILQNPTKLYKHRREFTQDEINTALKQFEWEKKLNDYSVNQLQQGKKYLDTVFNTATSAINVYNTAARVANTFNPDEKPWPYVPNIGGGDKKDKKDKK